jgi:hypothetical protein
MWGEINLSAYNGDQKFPQGTPLVYDVSVDLNGENQQPTGELHWDPTGPGFAVYEWFVRQEKYLKTQITVEYFYPRGKKVVFFFTWSGQSINYGNDMSVTVKLQSELAGLVNGNVRNTAQAYDEKKGASAVSVLNKTKELYGLDQNKNLVTMNEALSKNWQKVKLKNLYGQDWTFGNHLVNLARQLGDQVIPTNMGKTTMAVMSPWSFKDPKTGKYQKVLNGYSDVPAGQSPKPEERYAYLLGPNVIQTITRSANWKPPQQDNSNLPTSQAITQDSKTSDKKQQNPPTAQQVASANTTQAAKKTSAVQGTANGRANPGVENLENPNGPDKQIASNEEKGSDLSLTTFMCPLLVGIKPGDIIYVPSLTGKYIEDWIVQNVGYDQSNGAVTINVSATRTLGLGTPMNPDAAKTILDFAKNFGLVGEKASLENWDRYAWSLPGEVSQSSTVSPSTSAQEKFFNPEVPKPQATPTLLGGV